MRIENIDMKNILYLTSWQDISFFELSWISEMFDNDGGMYSPVLELESIILGLENSTVSFCSSQDWNSSVRAVLQIE